MYLEWWTLNIDTISGTNMNRQLFIMYLTEKIHFEYNFLMVWVFVARLEKKNQLDTNALYLLSLISQSISSYLS